MNINDFKTTVSSVDGYLRELSTIELTDLKKYMGELSSNLKDFKEGGDDLISEGNILKIGVVGQVKAGKSSFLNSLFFDGETILPKASTPMTAGLTVLEYADQNHFEVEYYNQSDWSEFVRMYESYSEIEKEIRASKDFEGAPESFILKEIKSRTTEIQQSAYELVTRCDSFAKRKIGMNVELVTFDGVTDLQNTLNQYVGADGQYTSVVKSLKISLQDERLKGIRIVDTPGVNDPIVSRENRTRQFLHSCHGVFFLSYSSRFFDSTDVNFMNTRISNQGVGTVLLLASKYDDVLQDQGLKYKDDLEQADEMSRKSLEKRYRNQLLSLDNQNLNIKFDTTSGISYSLATKPLSKWDEIETHVANRMKTLFPSAFETEEDSKDTFLVLANLDVIRKDYLEGMFKQNKDTIIQSKINDYFEQNSLTFNTILNECLENLSQKQKEINTVELKNLKEQKKQQDNLFDDLKDKFFNFIETFKNALQTEAISLSEKISRPCMCELPKEETDVSVRHKGELWGHNITIVTTKQVDTNELQKEISKQIEQYIKQCSKSWEDHFVNGKKEMFDSFCDSITEAVSKSTNLGFSDKYYRNLVSKVLSDVDQYRVLKLADIGDQLKNKIQLICDDQQFKIFDTNYEVKENQIQSVLNKEVDKKSSLLKQRMNSELTTLSRDVNTAMQNNVKSTFPYLNDLETTICEKLQTSGTEYLQQLEEELKNKEQMEKSLKLALERLHSLKEILKM